MNRAEAINLLEKEYGAATLEDDPEWVAEMVEILLDDPHYLDRP